MKNPSQKSTISHLILKSKLKVAVLGGGSWGTAIREMKRFIKDVYKMKRNINNSAYLGDLLVTGYSAFSRNRSFGRMIGKGYSVKTAQMEMRMVAEGYYATQCAKMINQNYSTRVPIIDAVFSILYLGKNPEKVFKKLIKKLD